MSIAFEAEILRNELASVAEEMALIVKRTARSTAARESGDYSTALMRADGELLAQGMAHGIHLGSMAGIMPHVRAKFADRGFKPGDIVMSNDPYAGLSHLPDIVLIAPVFAGESLAGFVATEMHHSDIGGRFPGGMGARAQTLYEEGIRLPTVLLHDAEHVNASVLEIIRANVRRPEIVLGDLQAQVSAIRHGLRHFARIVDKYSLTKVDMLSNQLFDFDRAAIRNLTESMRAGEYSATEIFEDLEDPEVGLQVSATLRVQPGSLVFDFEGTDPQAPSAINSPLGLTRSAVLSVVRGFIGEGVNVTGGLFDGIDVAAPLGSLANPRMPGAVGARGALLWRIVDLATTLMSRAGATPAIATGEGGVSALVFAPAQGDWPVLLDLYAGGWGARSNSDGIDGTSSLISGGMLRTTSAEIMELEYPVVLEEFALVPDTEGAGKYRGTLGVSRAWRFEESGDCELRVCRRDTVAEGIAGGAAGSPSVVSWIRDGTSLDVPPGPQPSLKVEAGDVLRHVQPGGGGYGAPCGRAPEAIESDLVEGKITSARARSVYGREE